MLVNDEINCPFCDAVRGRLAGVLDHILKDHPGNRAGEHANAHYLRFNHKRRAVVQIKCWCGQAENDTEDWAVHIEANGGLLEHILFVALCQ